jgi:dinuclear metal center YbgI/SA1388 family protein
MPPLRDLLAVLDRAFDPSWAEPWDAVGLVCGDPEAEVTRVHLAVDPVVAVAEEALAAGAQLLVTHHPLFLGGTTSVAAGAPKGDVVHRLVRGGCALFNAHTNADVASPGVSDALAKLFGLLDVRPLRPAEGEPRDKLVTFVPPADVDRVLDAMAAAGAGRIGEYDRCAFLSAGTGTFRPGAAANPTIGQPGVVERTEEVRVEMVAPRAARGRVVRALLGAHPYEEPTFDVVELAAIPAARGLGRVGRLPEPLALPALTRRAADVLPRTAWGVRAAGDPDLVVDTLAVCGGSGGELAAQARRAGAQALLTSDLKHHAASESVGDGFALLDAAHWATEAPWLRLVARLLDEASPAGADTVNVTVSGLVTDPWTLHEPQRNP